MSARPLPATDQTETIIRDAAAEAIDGVLSSVLDREGSASAHEHAMGLLIGAARWLGRNADPLYAATAISKAGASLQEASNGKAE